MAMQECKRAILGKALEDLVARARSGKEPCRIGLMASGGEHSDAEFLAAASAAMSADPALTVVGVGPKPSGILPQGMDWIETGYEGPELASGMENALAQGHIHGAVALHYPFPLGVTTVGRVLTPGTGKPLFMASCTGMSAAHRQEAMLRNAILGVAVAKALGITCPSVGVLNLDAAPQVLRALNRMAEKGYPLNLGQSVRGDGGSLLRGNDLLCSAVDVCVADTLTGNVLMKVFSAFTSGGSYETSGWGYGPSVGEGWDKVVSIVSILVVMVVLLFTFNSAGMPLLLILVIEGSIWINFSFPTISGKYLFFLGYLIVSSIQMGANIDYAIVIGSRYQELKAGMSRREAIIETLNFAFPTIITSGSILAICGFLIGNLTSEPVIAGIGESLGRGTVISIFLVMFVLPQILLVGTAFIDRTSFSMPGVGVGEHKALSGKVFVNGMVRGQIHGTVRGQICAMVDGDGDLNVISGAAEEDTDGAPGDTPPDGGEGTGEAASASDGAQDAGKEAQEHV